MALLAYLALTAALYAWLPRAMALSWLLVVYTFVIGMFGSLLEDLPGWALRISPFEWVPTPFSGEIEAARLLVLGGAVLAGFVVAFVGFRRRDLTGA